MLSRIGEHLPSPQGVDAKTLTCASGHPQCAWVPALPSLQHRKPVLQWCVLLALTAVLAPALQAVHLPAAFMLGPLAAAIVVAAADGTVRIPSTPFVFAEALIGCMIARVLQLPILREISHDWPLFLAAVMAVLIVSSSLSWLLMRWRVLPGTTAIWGSFPGAAMVMILMSEAYGEDVRLVAFMQYVRMVCVAVAASLVARLALGSLPHASATMFPPVDASALLGTIAIAAVGAWLGPKLRLPGGALLLPMALAVILQDSGTLHIELPPWLLAACFAVIGWSIGARFTRPILVHAARAAPRVLLSTVALIVICGAIGHALAEISGVDPLTAFLATSPGGIDSVVIIAANSNVNLPFIVAMQTARFILILLLGPAMARFLARRAAVSPS
jgi:membrane AbrB-like protein